MNTSSFRSAAHRVLTQARKELLGLFETPVAYIVTILFLGVSEFLFFKNVFLAGEASLALYYNFLPWILLFVVPALTMGSFAQERETGTYETLATQPLSELEVLLGKIVAFKVFLAGALALAVFPMAISFSFFSNIDWGMVWGGYFAGVCLSVLFASVGLAISSMFTKQVSSLLVTITALFFLIIAGTDMVAGTVPLSLTLLFERISVMSHFQSMTRGVIDVRDVWYFLSVIPAFLALTQYRLLALRFGGRHPTRTSWRIGVSILVVTVLVSNVLGSAIPGRLDLTRDQLYTLSDATKRVATGLPDIVNITLYSSPALPAQLQPILRDVRDMLKDYERYGNGNITVTIKDPSTSDAAKAEAEQNDVQQVQFNVMGQSELSVKQGYLGVVISYGGKHQSIPFIQQTSDLEYQLTSMIAELTVINKKSIAFLTGHGEKSRESDFTNFAGELAKQYTVSDLTIDDKSTPSASSTSVIVIADPQAPLGTSTRAYLDRYIRGGGAVLALVNGVEADARSLSAAANNSDIIELLKGYGVTVHRDLVYDLRSNETVQMGGGGMTYLVQYPFWARAGAIPGSPITAKIESVMMPWASSVAVDESALASQKASSTPLIATSPYAGLASEPYDITPNKQLPTDNLAQQVLAYAISNESTKGRMVVVGSAGFLAGDVTSHDTGNLALGLSAVSWLAQDESLASIKVKSGQRRTFTFGSPVEQSFVAYGNMTLVVLIPILIGVVFYVRRRGKSKLSYTQRPIL
jgi:ABC-type uncharacterized transport system involved in gliding motility auxiliary subunit/ABC-type transport system involved in multi-copper enzyme maturation permease subunit